MALACSWATTATEFHLLKNPTGSSNEDTGAQIHRLKGLIGDRKVAALIVSAGINDAGFPTIIESCVEWSHCWDHEIRDPLSGNREVSLSRYADTHLEALDHACADLHKEIQQGLTKQPEHVYLVECPDPFRDENGKLCETLLGHAQLGITQAHHENEVSEAEQDFLSGIRRHQVAATHRYSDDHWTFQNAAYSFEHHGACAKDPWFVDLETALKNINPRGTLHPNAAGHRAQANSIFGRLKHDLLPGLDKQG